ncbi:hypothetical protein TNCV_2119151 [Trichonephila clavipes]|nr:hypothetical protein TNCV_2119151 [Trichonephila clavipes]
MRDSHRLRNLGLKSSDDNDSRTGTYSPTYHTKPTNPQEDIELHRFDVHLPSLHIGSSVALELEPAKLRQRVRDPNHKATVEAWQLDAEILK